MGENMDKLFFESTRYALYSHGNSDFVKISPLCYQEIEKISVFLQ